MHLSQLISQTSKAAPAVGIGAGGEALYRMVVPGKVAAQVGSGLVKPMASKAASGGVRSALMGSSKIAAQATFVPVAGKAAAAGAAGGSAATAGVAAAGAGALTVAAPLVLMALAVGVSAHADHKRQQAIEKITTLLEKLHNEALLRERSALNGCRDAIDKATAILLDQGRIGASLGLDSAVHAISTALADAEDRLKQWRQGLAQVDHGPVEIAKLRETFGGIDDECGEFRAHLELAALAIALKKRVIVLQAVEHAQMDLTNPFESFVRALKADQQRVTRVGVRNRPRAAKFVDTSAGSLARCAGCRLHQGRGRQTAAHVISAARVGRRRRDRRPPVRRRDRDRAKRRRFGGGLSGACRVEVAVALWGADAR